MKLLRTLLFVLVALASCTEPDNITPQEKPSSGNKPNTPTATSTNYIPVIMEEFRELYHPSAAVGIYVNDHTVFPRVDAKEGDADKWNVIGITNYELLGGEGETHFANGVGSSLAEGKFIDNPNTGGMILNALYKQADPTPNPNRDGYLCWAPHVVYHDGLYHMFYFSYLPNKWDMEYATSSDLINWKDMTSELTLSVQGTYEGLIYEEGNIAQTRDPMVLKYGDVWLMYATSMWLDEGIKRGAVAVYQSSNLKNWTFKGYALRNLDGAPIANYSSCESPFVIFKDGRFILSVTITISDGATYHDSIIFVSDNPYDFGTYSGATKLGESKKYVGRISAHCPEFIYDEAADKWYVTSAGWSDMVKHEGAKGGVGIAEIQWMTPKEYDDYNRTVCRNHKSGVLNHSFEDGYLEEWKTTGDFDTHMINDAFKSRYGTYRDMVGRRTFCSYADNNRGGDAQTGSMRSNDFIINSGAKMTFYIAGGNDLAKLYVALVDAQTGNIIYKETGRNTENSRKIKWDLSEHAGKRAYVEVVDNSTVAWGHIGVDCILVDGQAIK